MLHYPNEKRTLPWPNADGQAWRGEKEWGIRKPGNFITSQFFLSVYTSLHVSRSSRSSTWDADATSSVLSSDVQLHFDETCTVWYTNTHATPVMWGGELSFDKCQCSIDLMWKFVSLGIRVRPSSSASCSFIPLLKLHHPGWVLLFPRQRKRSEAAIAWGGYCNSLKH